MKEWMNEWIENIKTNEWMSKRSIWINKWAEKMNEWMNEVYEWMNEWSIWIKEWLFKQFLRMSSTNHIFIQKYFFLLDNRGIFSIFFSYPIGQIVITPFDLYGMSQKSCPFWREWAATQNWTRLLGHAQENQPPSGSKGVPHGPRREIIIYSCIVLCLLKCVYWTELIVLIKMQE